MQDNTIKRVMFWTRIGHRKYDEWKLVEGIDRSNVPANAWKTFNKLFWEMKTLGKLCPLDEMDAYQHAVSQMLIVAENPPELKRAKLATYLVGVGKMSLLNLAEREGKRKREEYAAMYRTCRVSEASDECSVLGEDRFDREWSDRSYGTLDVVSFLGLLMGKDPDERMLSARLARECVDETMPKLSVDAQRGLTAFMLANGVWDEAPAVYGRLCVAGYRKRFFTKWAPAFRLACTWSW